MAQDHQEHLTLEQLSAYLDGALSSEEEAFCAAHLPHCASCRSELASLRLTRDLLRALPRATPPRAFTLTPELLRTSSTPEWQESVTSDTSAAAEEPVALSAPLPSALSPQRRQLRPTDGAGARRQNLRRVVRVLSALAAVIALALLLSGLLTSLRGGSSSTMSTAVQRAAEASATPPFAQQEGPVRTPAAATEGPRGVRPGSTGTPASASSTAEKQPDRNLAALPEAALSTPAERLLLGGLLLIVALIGLLMTRKARSPSWPGHDQDEANRQAAH
ncbi:MAG: zf-HC2 domain-containing protein [Thermogemmatispora sp.]|uniref:anti-sigma factor family protein n=1 Tax=Thermogemmatispora sp. TaxID=1968838 RepID=UPI0026317F38|nr:zf-HC2 domain-containing protein [Thermogemmatispora sp.]MBX5455525.1 zf-HC2 domain-containing protein [Thermogemmatispora sp.]